MADAPIKNFMEPNAFDRVLNRAFGLLLRFGFGLSHNYLLEVRGRRSGKAYSTPVNVLNHQGRKYLVAPRGHTQWARNVAISGRAALVKKTHRQTIRLRAVADEQKADILKAYLERFRPTVQRYFPVPAGSPVEAFKPLAERYPVFELID